MTVVRRVDKAAMEPVLNLMTRGPQARQELVNDLVADMYACSSRGPRDSQLNTWMQYHALWYGAESSPWPMDERSIIHVSALFKAGGYRSFKNYLSRAKEHHLMLGHPWTDRLDLIARKCSRSVLRGLAGASRSEPFDLFRVVSCLAGDDGPFHPEGPVHVRALISCSTMYLLREVEASAIDIADVTMSDGAVSLNLPISKVDWKAKGCTRTWSCVCDTSLPCPFHILQDHLTRLETFYRKLQMEADPSLPLFPNPRGGYCTKNGVTSTLRYAIEKAGMSATARDGTWNVSGHSFRITGARTLAKQGLDPITIQLIGRWGSDAVLSYIAESPLDGFADRLKREGLQSMRISRDEAVTRAKATAAGLDAKAHLASIVSDLDRHRKEREELLKKLTKAEHDIEDINDKMEGVLILMNTQESYESWVVDNTTSEVRHLARVCLKFPPAQWKTLCGLPFSAKLWAKTTRPPEQPEDNEFKKCPKCHPKHTSNDASSSSSS